ncbi:unnamed protein product [Spirodela intermedia]|uniref:Uncharacterized protein n=1 Tax=Spirodela intermedia TaxID=51605 RepID=A0A7I8IQB3_SPIIN|nr:unnamed protein product [Spirodela intermedia]CAA6659704.1 unnamed protein product [Spirodela intermedia]
MGNGHSTKGKGICQGVVLKMQGLTMVEHYLPLKLRSTDVILNKQWLKSVRWIRIHWALISQFATDLQDKLQINFPLVFEPAKGLPSKKGHGLHYLPDA